MTARRRLRGQGKVLRSRKPLAALAAFGLFGISAGFAALSTPSTPASADSGDGSLTVQVVRDVNGNGTYDSALETPESGIPVTATDNDGNTSEAKTGDDGNATIDTSSLKGGKYRVDASIPDSKSNLKPAPAGDDLSSLTEFTDVSGGQDQTITMGVWDPGQYTGENPELALPIQKYAEADETRGVVTFPYDQRGDNEGTEIATQDEVGTTHGEAYDKVGQRVFVGAMAKRHTEYGPGGAGAIYVVPRDGSEAPKEFATVPNAGDTEHGDAFKDPDFFDAPGKESLGDLEISEDGKTLYAVNLNDKSLYEFDATGDTGESKGDTKIPDPGCAAAGDWRPFGLGTKGADLYVGGVCSAESTGKKDDLKAVVYSYDGSDFTKVMDESLNFERGYAHSSQNQVDGRGNYWQPWVSKFSRDLFPPQSGGQYIRPTPELSDIVFDGDNMVLGFKDRIVDQMGWQAPPPTPGDDDLMNFDSGGDLSKACKDGDTYTLDANNPDGDCTNNAATNDDGGQADGVQEFFSGDYGLGDDPASHQEAALGGVALAEGQDLASTGYDPTGKAFSSGVGFYDRESGEGQGNDPSGRGNQLVSGDTSSQQSQNGFSKAGGLGDLEVLADNAPMQIGNRVWYDEDKDGEQDAAEGCLPGTQVSLKDSSGEEIASTETNDKCEYYFGGADQPDLIKPDTDYTVDFDACSADTSGIEGAPDAAELKVTKKEAVDDTRHDSNVEQSGSRDCTATAEITTPKTPGHAYHTVDAGFYGPNECTIGDYVWSDDNENGIQDEGEAGVEGVEVELVDSDGNPVEGQDGEPVTATTDGDGKYLLSGMECGTYKVKFTAPDGKMFTKQEAGDSPKADSNPDSTGVTKDVTVSEDKPDDMKVDAGLTPEKCKIGDYVWNDDNSNGIQDSGESPVSGVTVSLLDEEGNPVEAGGDPVTTTTDADGTYSFDVKCGNYKVKFSNLPEGATFTEPAQGPDIAKDSNPDPSTGVTPTVEVTSDDPEDMTIDAGIVGGACVGSVGDFVWDDRNGDGIQDSGEPEVSGVTVELLDSDGKVVKTSDGEDAQVVTDENGKYTFTQVPCGDYKVRFSGLPEGTGFTTQGAGDDPAVDSDPDPETGETAVFKVKGKVPTIDAGIVKGGSLPYTGAEIGLASLLGAALIGAGALLVVAVRRKRRGSHAGS